MIDNRVATHAGVMRHLAGAAIPRHLTRTAMVGRLTGTAALMTALLLAGCSGDHAADTGTRLRVYAADLAGAAKVCDVPNIDPLAGGNSEAPIKMVNDGGWCSLRVHQDGPKPYGAGLLTTRPDHGTILIHEVGDDTRIDYTPDRGFAGRDTFAVRLIPGNANIRVMVTVTSPPKPTGS